MPKRNDYPIGSNIERVADTEPEEIAPEIRDYVASVVDELPEEYRMIIEMRVWQQQPFRAIAKMLGYKSHASIVAKYYEALDMIKEGLDEDNLGDS